MFSFMTASTEGNQVIEHIETTMRPELLMMYFEVGRRSTSLTTPPVTTQHRAPQYLVLIGREPPYLCFVAHAAFSVRC